jgi:hypothetical protein
MVPDFAPGFKRGGPRSQAVARLEQLKAGRALGRFFAATRERRQFNPPARPVGRGSDFPVPGQTHMPG